MPEQVRQDQRPELGQPTLSDYLDANRGTLDQDFGRAQSDAAQWNGTGSGPGGVEGATELSRQLGSEGGLAGSGRLGAPMSDASSFNAGLNWAAHGPGYQGLSSGLASWMPPAPPSQQIDPGISKRTVPSPAPAAPVPSFEAQQGVARENNRNKSPGPGWKWSPDAGTWVWEGGR